MVRLPGLSGALLWHILILPGDWVCSLRSHNHNCDEHGVNESLDGREDSISVQMMPVQEDSFTWRVSTKSALLAVHDEPLLQDRSSTHLRPRLPLLTTLSRWSSEVLPTVAHTVRTAKTWLQTAASDISCKLAEQMGKTPEGVCRHTGELQHDQLSHGGSNRDVESSKAELQPIQAFSTLELVQMMQRDSSPVSSFLLVGTILCVLACCFSACLQSSNMETETADRDKGNKGNSSSSESEVAQNVRSRLKTKLSSSKVGKLFTRKKKKEPSEQTEQNERASRRRGTSDDSS